MKPVLIFRADAGVSIGVGHVMRCLALAQAWQDQGGKAVFACAQLPHKIVDRFEQEQIAVQLIDAQIGSERDAEATAAVAQAEAAEWVVIDGYSFTEDYFELLRGKGLRILALDDMAHLDRYPVDILLNQNLSADPSLYASRLLAGTTLLLGPRYSLLRREFRLKPPRRRVWRQEDALRVLVTMGGSDADNYTASILSNLQRTAPGACEVVVLAGAANPHAELLRVLAGHVPFRCDVFVDAQNVADLMDDADVAICGGGSTVWELAARRVPALIGAAEANQLAGIEALAKVPFFKAMRIEHMLECDLGVELAHLAGRKDEGGSADFGFDADGSLRVMRQILTKTSALLFS